MSAAIKASISQKTNLSTCFFPDCLCMHARVSCHMPRFPFETIFSTNRNKPCNICAYYCEYHSIFSYHNNHDNTIIVERLVLHPQVKSCLYHVSVHDGVWSQQRLTPARQQSQRLHAAMNGMMTDLYCTVQWHTYVDFSPVSVATCQC